MFPRPRLVPYLLLVLGACSSSGDRREGSGETQRPGGDLGAATAGLRRLEGFLELYWDAEKARLLFEVPAPEREVLYYVSLPGGLGSNDVGLDRGQLGFRALVVFRPVGERVLMVAPNLRWRSSSPDPVERRGVRDAFAESVLHAFDVVAQEDGRTLVDGTAFFLRDAHDVARKLEDSEQGRFRLAEKKSVILPEALANFPQNTEVEALLTFDGERPGPEVRSTAAVASSVSLRVRHSFVALPKLGDDGYRPRPFDPTSGYFPFVWNDLSAPIDEPIRQTFLTRHHLSADQPIVYYVDRAAPEPVRTALLEGARYWEPAFTAAGFPGGYRVELLPPDADPQDLRYNVIQWVPRSTRGWSYGMSVVDPRTGRILKGHVSLGALRVRQDVLLFEGLLSPYAVGRTRDERVLEASLSRIRQLSAHEVGHTLGLTHNFAASLDGRASVMDYPAPEIRMDENGELDLSRAYAQGGGAWDVFSIRYGYTAFATPDEENAGLAALVDELSRTGASYLTDYDARGRDRAHPRASLWDTGDDPLLALENTYSVRRRALARFSAGAVKPGRPFFELERALVPLFFHHRYQLEASIRFLGGITYEYAVVGREDNPGMEAVDADAQRRALELALESLTPAFLALPPKLIELLPPPPPGSRRDRETFQPRRLFFDPLDAASAATELTLSLLLDPTRAARLADQPRRDGTLPSLAEVLERLVADVWSEPEEPPIFRAVRLEVQAQTLEHLFALASDEDVPTRVRAAAFERLTKLRERLALEERDGPHAAFEREQLRRFFDDPSAPRFELRPDRVPPGAPIGCDW